MAELLSEEKLITLYGIAAREIVADSVRVSADNQYGRQMSKGPGIGISGQLQKMMLQLQQR